MKYLSVFLFSLLISFNIHAEEYIEKPFSLGFGLYRSVIAVDDPFYEDDELSGVGFSLAYAISNEFAIRGTFFSLDHDDFSALESSGYDITGHVGINLASPGFKAYIGGGIFKDKWEVTGFSKTFKGLQLNGGLGYNWESVSLDFIVGIRDAGDYEDFVNEALGDNVSATAVTSMLLLSARF